GCKLDKEKFTVIRIHQQYNVPNHRCDKGSISQNVLSNKRKQGWQWIYSIGKLLASIGSIRKLFSIEQWSGGNRVVFHSPKWINVPTLADHKESSTVNKLKYQEQLLVIKECELDLREREAKVHLVELANFEKEQRLKSAS
ncbi:hypothetical protein F8M41_004471, partial [Gigaspora margarita]